MPADRIVADLPVIFVELHRPSTLQYTALHQSRAIFQQHLFRKSTVYPIDLIQLLHHCEQTPIQFLHICLICRIRQDCQRLEYLIILLHIIEQRLIQTATHGAQPLQTLLISVYALLYLFFLKCVGVLIFIHILKELIKALHSKSFQVSFFPLLYILIKHLQTG